MQQVMPSATTLLPGASCTLECIRGLCNASCPDCDLSPGNGTGIRGQLSSWAQLWCLPVRTPILCFALQALQTGAASYLTPEQRFQMGIVRPSHRDEAADHSHALRFTAYERTAAPAAAAGQTAGGRGSPAFGQRDSPVSQAGELLLPAMGQHPGYVNGSDAESLRPAGSCVRTAIGFLSWEAHRERTPPLEAAGACCRGSCQRKQVHRPQLLGSATSGISISNLQGRQRQPCLHQLLHLWRQLLLSAVSPSYGPVVVPGGGALPASALHRPLHWPPQGPHELQVRHSLPKSGHCGQEGGDRWRFCAWGVYMVCMSSVCLCTRACTAPGPSPQAEVLFACQIDAGCRPDSTPPGLHLLLLLAASWCSRPVCSFHCCWSTRSRSTLRLHGGRSGSCCRC